MPGGMPEGIHNGDCGVLSCLTTSQAGRRPRTCGGLPPQLTNRVGLKEGHGGTMDCAWPNGRKKQKKKEGGEKKT